MRKFNYRWRDGEDLRQWRSMVECGQYFAPFFMYPYLGGAEGAMRFDPTPAWMRGDFAPPWRQMMREGQRSLGLGLSIQFIDRFDGAMNVMDKLDARVMSLGPLIL